MVSAGEAFLWGGKYIMVRVVRGEGDKYTHVLFSDWGQEGRVCCGLDWIWGSFWRLRTGLQQGDSSLRHHG